MDIARRNTDATAAKRFSSFTRSHDSRTIRSNEPRLLPGHGALDLDHVIDGNSFGDADHQIDGRIDRFKNRISGKRWWNKNRGGGRARRLHRFGHRIENGNLILETLATLAGRDSGNYLRSITQAQFGVAAAEAARDPLDQDFSGGSY